MVALAVVGHDAVDLGEVDLALEVAHEVKAVGCPDGVHEDGLLLLDEVGVLARAVLDGVVIAMKALELPVDVAHPADVSRYLLAHGRLLS